jgi:hypothetical protein
MSYFVNLSQFAKICEVSRQTIATNVKRGLIERTKRGIDLDSETNQYYRAQALLKKRNILTRKKVSSKKRGRPPKTEKQKNQEKKEKEKKKKNLDRLEKIKKENQKEVEKYREYADDVAAESINSVVVDAETQRKYEDTRLKKIKADREVLKYAAEIGAMIDIETLKQKIGAFKNFLLTELIYMPEDISDLLWMSARDSEDPERTIREMLSQRIEKIIEEAKKSSAQIVSLNKAAQYVMLDLDEQKKDE